MYFVVSIIYSVVLNVTKPFLPIRIFGVKPFLVRFLEMDNINVCLVNSLHISLAWVHTHRCGSVNSCHCNPNTKEIGDCS